MRSKTMTGPSPRLAADLAARPWQIGEQGLQLATIVDAAAPETILAYVYLPEEDRATGLHTLALMVAAPRLVRVLGELRQALQTGTARDCDRWLSEADALLARLAEGAPDDDDTRLWRAAPALLAAAQAVHAWLAGVSLSTFSPPAVAVLRGQVAAAIAAATGEGAR